MKMTKQTKTTVAKKSIASKNGQIRTLTSKNLKEFITYQEVGDGTRNISKCSIPSMGQYLHTGVSDVRTPKGYPVFFKEGSNTLYINVKGRLKSAYCSRQGVAALDNKNYDEYCILLPTKGNSKDKCMLLVNGEIEHGFDDYRKDYCLVVFSPSCVSRLLFNNDVSKKNVSKVWQIIADGSLKLIDFTADIFIDAKSDVVKFYKDYGVHSGSWKARRKANEKFRNTKHSPGKGYTLINSDIHKFGIVWHKASHLLFQHGNKYYLCGQDEGQYFGVELPEKVKTVEDAILSLMPKAIRNVRDVERQGEWFFVPVSKSECLTISDETHCMAEHLILPFEKGGNSHNITGGEIFISSTGKVYLSSCYVCHDQHEELNLDAHWYTPIKNTAVRSVSQEGVD